ncbi:hypothetical protein CYMTET_20373 [Cymbomonas tetramitiformis]|uniref:Uncharacterized protein n=1 Tax=Cymbomonas tetramitiformis TaxID=36881 RepID=A0AAE0G468_9CHLO|nr:hypothetical protein CYMTET_20373 [Cymbomonas tetramitiformis]
MAAAERGKSGFKTSKPAPLSLSARWREPEPYWITSEDTILIGSDGEPSIITQTPTWPLMNCNIGGTVVKMEGGGCVHMGGCVVQRPEVLQR